MIINKYQQGGIYSPYIFGNLQGKQESAPSKTVADKEEDKLDKAIIDLVQANGLQNDVDYTLGEAKRFLAQMNDPLAIGGANKMGTLIKLQSLVNRVKRNKESYNEAVKKVNSEGAGSEVAMTSTGQIYAYDTNGEIKTISATKLADNPDQYQALTNSQLLELRERMPNLAFTSTITNDLQDTIGMKSLMNYVNGLIAEFGENTNENKNSRYTQKERGMIERGFEQILGGVSPDGVYEVNTSNKASNTGYSSKEEFSAALNYLYKALPKNMRNVLTARTAVEGGDPTKAGDVMGVLASALMENTKHIVSNEINLNYKGARKDAKSGSGDGSKSMSTKTFGESVLGNYGTPRTGQIVLPGGEIGMNLRSWHYDLRDFKNNTALPNVSNLANTTRQLQGHGIFDSSAKIYFGNKPIDAAVESKNILIDNTKGMDVVYLPVNSNGEIDFSVLELMGQVQNEISEKHIEDVASLKKIWNDNGFEYDESTGIAKPPHMSVKKFAVQTGYTSNDGVDKSKLKDNQFLNEMPLSNLMQIQGIFNTDPLNKEYGKVNLDLVGWTNAYYGMVFIPLAENELQTRIAGGTAFQPKNDIDDIKARQDMARQAGEYDYNTGSWDRTLRGGLTIDDLN